ncbi:MAG: hypothetical protein PUJ55_05720 [Clostridiales bacterium]|nr:hypothetical protein [Roseburia sp.]MDD7636420.1 hypothetical protein [Clostridiales bacterium]
MIGYPLDSHVEYDTDGTPIYDRAITSAPLRKLYKQLFSDGVMPNPSTNMQVSAGDGMNVIVSPGFAMCNGCLKLEEAQRTLAVQASSATYDRIDTVVLRLNDNDSERICDFYILEGTPATSPVRPTLTRTESIWEIGLADLFIAKNSTVISNQRITDTRYETERCGVISSVSKFDTDFIYHQVQADLAGFKSEEQADFIAWFEEIKGQLSEDAAGNLQNQIGTLPSLVTEVKTSIVAAINWVAEKLSTLASKIGTSDISKIGDGTVTGAIASQNETLAKINTDLSSKANAADLATKASTADLNAEKATREKVDASLQSQINDVKTVNAYGIETWTTNVTSTEAVSFVGCGRIAMFNGAILGTFPALTVITLGKLAVAPIFTKYGICSAYRDDSVSAAGHFTIDTNGVINVYIGGSGNYDKIVLDAVFMS